MGNPQWGRTGALSLFEWTKDTHFLHSCRVKEVFNVARMFIEVEARSLTSSLVTVLGIWVGLVLVVVEGAPVILGKLNNVRSHSLRCRAHTYETWGHLRMILTHLWEPNLSFLRVWGLIAPKISLRSMRELPLITFIAWEPPYWNEMVDFEMISHPSILSQIVKVRLHN